MCSPYQLPFGKRPPQKNPDTILGEASVLADSHCCARRKGWRERTRGCGRICAPVVVWHVFQTPLQGTNSGVAHSVVPFCTCPLRLWPVIFRLDTESLYLEPDPFVSVTQAAHELRIRRAISRVDPRNRDRTLNCRELASSVRSVRVSLSVMVRLR